MNETNQVIYCVIVHDGDWPDGYVVDDGCWCKVEDGALVVRVLGDEEQVDLDNTVLVFRKLYRRGELLLLDTPSGAELPGYGRKPHKWGVPKQVYDQAPDKCKGMVVYEEFTDLSAAIARMREIEGLSLEQMADPRKREG